MPLLSGLVLLETLLDSLALPYLLDHFAELTGQIYVANLQVSLFAAQIWHHVPHEIAERIEVVDVALAIGLEFKIELSFFG